MSCVRYNDCATYLDKCTGCFVSYARLLFLMYIKQAFVGYLLFAKQGVSHMVPT